MKNGLYVPKKLHGFRLIYALRVGQQDTREDLFMLRNVLGCLLNAMVYITRMEICIVTGILLQYIPRYFAIESNSITVAIML